MDLNSSTSGGQQGHKRSGRWYFMHWRTVGPRWGCATWHGYNQGTRTQLLRRHTVPASWWCCSGEGDKWPHTCHDPSLREETCEDNQKVRKIYLGSAPCIGDRLLLSLPVHQQVRDSDNWKGDICEGHVTEEERYAGVSETLNSWLWPPH